MKIKFLGTAAAEGWPGLFCQCVACERARKAGGKNIRTRSGCLIDDEIMVDFSPDTYMHVINNNIDLSKIRHLIITHSHMDHIFPSDLMLRIPPFAYIENLEPLEIYGNDKVGILIDDNKKRANVGDEIVHYNEVMPFESFNAGSLEVTPLLANHDINERCYIYMIRSGTKRILYGHDTGVFLGETFEAIKGHYFDCVILDCTSGPKAEPYYHMGFPNNAEMKEKLMRQGNADENTKFIVTHFSHNAGLLHDELVEAAAAFNFEVAYDGAEFII